MTNMSLLKETVRNVIQGNSVIIGNSLGSTFSQLENFRGYKVVTGASQPRAPGNYLFLDNETGEPIQMPPNSLPIMMFLIPTVPILDDGNSYYDIYLYDDTSFSNTYAPWGGNGSFYGSAINTKAMIGVNSNGNGTVFSNFAGYPYVGYESSGNTVTDGTIQIYVYYLTKD